MGGKQRAERTLAHKLFPGMLFTETEISAIESMHSEHAGYGSSRFHLQTILPTNGPNLSRGIGAEAAAVAFYTDSKGGAIDLVFSSESHNGPSYVCAHPGAATGTGGNQRDNAALTATKPDALFEARRQCHPLYNPYRDPVRQHTDETTRGIADYGNAMGIPHGGGSIRFHPQFAGNNLVNVMCTSIAPRERFVPNKVPIDGSDPAEYVGIYVGKASDLTGLGGTKFASQAIDMTKSDLNEKAVQDPDPHLQESVIRGLEMVVDAAMAGGWHRRLSVKDMGAAGLLCSTVEQLPPGVGVVIDGDLVPKSHPMSSMELLETETQERFFIYVHQDHAPHVLDIFNEQIGLPHINKGARAAIVARCTGDGDYVFTNGGIEDVNLPVRMLQESPLRIKPYQEPLQRGRCFEKRDATLTETVDAVLNSLNFKSDRYISEHYDSHIGGTNILTRGEACAPLRTHDLLEGRVGYSATFEANAVYGLIDPKRQAEDSFLRGAYKMACVGCSVVALTNNANYGRTDVPEEMWEFVEGQRGVALACRNWELEQAYLDAISGDPEIAAKLASDPRRHVTVASGNCSLNKANANTGTAIPPTTILGLIGWTNQPERYATWDLKPEHSSLYLIGERQERLDGSDLYQNLYGPEAIGTQLFDINYAVAQREVAAIRDAVRNGLVLAANDIEEGGLFGAVTEMIANSQQGVDTLLITNPGPLSETRLFSESYGAVLQISQSNRQAFLSECRRHGVTPMHVGNVQVSSGVSFLRTSDESLLLPQSEIQDAYHHKLERTLRGSA